MRKTAMPRKKCDIAPRLVLGLWNGRQGVLSVQVLQEFYVPVTRKLKKPPRSNAALEIVKEYLTLDRGREHGHTAS
jgi:hypothetical protein